ncbi:MAG: hypothetical protein R6U32_01825 [Candidatus Woesearchaeota archaeon]
MTGKRGQISTFIIIGLVILVAAGLFLYIRQPLGEEEVPSHMKAVKLFIDHCLEDTAEGAILLAGVQGGTIYMGDALPGTDTYYSHATYWYDNRKDTSISKTFIEKEINNYIERELEDRCINSFQDFHRNITSGNVSATTTINENSVDVVMEYPVTLHEGGDETTISRFAAEIPVRLGKAINIGRKIVDMEIENPEYVPLSKLGEMEMMVAPYKYSDDIMLYSVVDQENRVKGVNFKLVFANRFGNESSENRDPKLLNADNLLLFEGVETDYRFRAFDADNDPLTFSSVGDYDVAEDGTLSFTPGPDDIGEHMMSITVEDGNGGHDSESISIMVI